MRWAAVFLASATAFGGAIAVDPSLGSRVRPLGAFGPEDREAIGTAIETGNAILQDFYASGGDPALLSELPYSTAVRHQVFRDLGYLKSAGLVMVLDQADLVPVEIVRTAPDSAEALVFEEWNYLYQRADGREPVEPMRGLGQGFRYRLARRFDGWVVVGWEPEDVPVPNVRGGSW